MADIKELVDNFYKKDYSACSVTGQTNSLFSKYFHNALEKEYNELEMEKRRNAKILEVGCGNGEHRQFIAEENFQTYIMSDVRIPRPSPVFEKTRFIQASVDSLPFNDNQFDRVLTTCLLHHLEKPWEALKEIRRVVKKKSPTDSEGGLISIALPNDPGMLYRCTKKLANLPRRKIRRSVAFLEVIEAYEHRNHFLSLREMIRFEFRHDQLSCRAYPINISNYHLAAFNIYVIRL